MIPYLDAPVNPYLDPIPYLEAPFYDLYRKSMDPKISFLYVAHLRCDALILEAYACIESLGKLIFHAIAKPIVFVAMHLNSHVSLKKLYEFDLSKESIKFLCLIAGIISNLTIGWCDQELNYEIHIELGTVKKRTSSFWGPQDNLFSDSSLTSSSYGNGYGNGIGSWQEEERKHSSNSLPSAVRSPARLESDLEFSRSEKRNIKNGSQIRIDEEIKRKSEESPLRSEKDRSFTSSSYGNGYGNGIGGWQEEERKHSSNSLPSAVRSPARLESDLEFSRSERRNIKNGSQIRIDEEMKRKSEESPLRSEKDRLNMRKEELNKFLEEYENTESRVNTLRLLREASTKSIIEFSNKFPGFFEKNFTQISGNPEKIKSWVTAELLNAESKLKDLSQTDLQAARKELDFIQNLIKESEKKLEVGALINKAKERRLELENLDASIDRALEKIRQNS